VTAAGGAEAVTSSGVLISLEGGEGAGKTTLARLLAAELESAGLRARVLREPGGTALGEEVRRLLLHPDSPLTPQAELLLFLAARAELVRRVIRPALDAGEYVICDRFSDSTLAYQGFGRGLDLEEIRRLDAWASSGLKPDLTVLLDVPVETGLARRGAEKDVFQQADLDFHMRVREGYLQLANAEPGRWLTLNAGENPENSTKIVLKVLRSRIEHV
jgi:dTMP kinase